MLSFFLRYLRRHHVALLALFISLGGTTYAANTLTAHYAKIADRTRTRTANAAFSVYHESPIALPEGQTTRVLGLSVPRAGNYIITATFTAVDYSRAGGVSPISCQLWAGVPGYGSDTRPASSHVEYGKPDVVVLQLPFWFERASHAQLSCQDFGTGDVRAQWVTITAVQVARLTKTDG